MTVIYIQQGERHSLDNVGQLIYDRGFMQAYSKRGEFLGALNLEKCDDYTAVDNDSETPSRKKGKR